MARRKALKCRNSDCSEPPFLAGFCKRHDAEWQLATDRRNAAIALLHTWQLEQRPLEVKTLVEELSRVESWWRRACLAVNTRTKDPILGDQEQYAIEWCIGLAQLIVDQELAHRKRQEIPCPFTLEAKKANLWDCFATMETKYAQQIAGK